MRKLLKMISVLASALALMALPVLADGAHGSTASVILNFIGPNSSSVTCTAVAASFTVPVAAGTPVVNCTVAPTTWSGAFTMTGPAATSFVLAGSGTAYTISVGTSPYTVIGSTTLTLTATP